MIALGRLLVPTDYSDCSRAAYEVASDLAAEFGATLDLVHVWSAPYFGPGYGYAGEAVLDPLQQQSMFDLIRDRAREDMDAFAASVPPRTNVRITTHVESGDPSRVVLALAEQMRPDLIVMGTHGRTGAKRWLLGSVAERVVQHAPSSVLTVPMRDSAI